MQAEIITIGDEILIGQVIDTNSAYIAKALNRIGISVYQITSVQDDKDHILQSFAAAEKRVDLVITNGLRESGKPLSTITLSGKNSSYIVGGYQYGTQLGRVDLRVIKSGGKARLASFFVQSIPLDDNEYDPGLRRDLIKWERSYCKRWGKPLGQGRLRNEMSRDNFVKYFLNYARRLGQG
ncbi:MAG: hypothetical protein KDD04_11650, partial [Sinomicrobium sp.]|nr:hypothetical protein [Sinomicrobium sp.]